MKHNTGIEWTHVPGYKGETWNPVRGCEKISPGCKHCYAETLAERWRGVIMPNGKPHAYHQGFDLRLVPDKLDEPLRATKPRAYFVNSMSDLFQESVPSEFVAATFGVMAATSRHLYMVLTKRADRMAEFMRTVPVDEWSVDGTPMRSISFGDDQSEHPLHPLNAADLAIVESYKARNLAPYDALEDFNNATLDCYFQWPPPNVWLGVSVEDRKYGLPRIDILRETPAAVRFLSIEPLLEDLGPLDLRGIHWVIVGGESGPGARTLQPEWVMPIRDQCAEQGVPFFFKQWGGVMKKLKGRVLDGRTHDAFPIGGVQ
jgi:protein gp37